MPIRQVRDWPDLSGFVKTGGLSQVRRDAGATANPALRKRLRRVALLGGWAAC